MRLIHYNKKHNFAKENSLPEMKEAGIWMVIHSISTFRLNYMKNNQKKIPLSASIQIGTFFGFVFFNSMLVAMRGVFIAITFLSCYYLFMALKKSFLKSQNLLQTEIAKQ